MTREEKTSIILGPPGTGKTTRLLEIVDTMIGLRRINPDQICFVSFTKKAANEARERAMEKFKLTLKQVPYFRTLHSLAFLQLGVDKKDMMKWTDYVTVAKAIGLTISSQTTEEGQFYNHATKGDRLYFMEGLSRAGRKSLHEIWSDFQNDGIDYQELDLLAKTLQKYKDVNKKLDFTDLIEKFVAINSAPKFHALFVDEAQDLSRLQWEMVEILAGQSEKVYIAGDDDQAIYTWAGAYVQYFQGYPGVREILGKSYRVPGKIHSLATKVIARVRNRVQKTYTPASIDGNVQCLNDLSRLDMSQGTWLLLARNIWLLSSFSEHCFNQGLIYHSRGGSIVDQELGPAIITWERLRKGEQVPASEIKLVYAFLGCSGLHPSVRWGSRKMLEAEEDNRMIGIELLQKRFGLLTDEPWHKAMKRASRQDITFYQEAMSKGEDILTGPRININTIHSVKGGEADNVVIQLDMAKRTFEDMEHDPDSEHRVWYVALTRAKKNVYIIPARTQYFYDLLPGA